MQKLCFLSVTKYTTSRVKKKRKVEDAEVLERDISKDVQRYTLLCRRCDKNNAMEDDGVKGVYMKRVPTEVVKLRDLTPWEEVSFEGFKRTVNQKMSHYKKKKRDE